MNYSVKMSLSLSSKQGFATLSFIAVFINEIYDGIEWNLKYLVVKIDFLVHFAALC